MKLMFQGFWVCPFSSRPHCCSYYYRVFVFTCVLVPNCCTKVTLQFCFFSLKWDLSGRFSPLYPLHLLLQFSNLPIYGSTDVLVFFLFPVLSGSNLSRYIVTLSGSGSARCFFFFICFARNKNEQKRRSGSWRLEQLKCGWRFEGLCLKDKCWVWL